MSPPFRLLSHPCPSLEPRPPVECKGRLSHSGQENHLQARIVFSVVFSCFLLAPLSLQGQECFGALRDGEVGVGAGATIFDGGASYGGGIDYNGNGLVSLGAGFSITTLDDFDENWKGVGGSLGIEIPGLEFGLCPWAGVSYSWIEFTEAGGTADFSTLRIPLGLAIGKAFEVGDEAYFIPTASAALLWYRNEGNVTIFGVGSESAQNTQTEFSGSVGGTFRIKKVYFGLGAGFTTIEQSEPTYGIGVGFVVN